MSKSTFVSDLHGRILDAERIIANQNENLAALRLLLGKELGESIPKAVTPVKVAPAPKVTPAAKVAPAAKVTPTIVQAPSEHPAVDFKGKTSDIIISLVQQSGGHGTRPRDIAEILLKRKLIKKGSNTVHSHLSELKKKGVVQQKAEGLYVASSKPAAVKPAAVSIAPVKKAKKKRKLTPEGREAIRKAVIARWAAVKKAAPVAKAGGGK